MHRPASPRPRQGRHCGGQRPRDRPHPHPQPRRGGDDSHAKRKARLVRLAHATETFAKPRGGFSQTDLTRLALHGLIHEAGRDALVWAVTMLGDDQPRDITVERLLDGVDTTAGPVRVAGAVALWLAENHMYWSSGSPQCRDYLALLTRSGWTPDDWTATVLAHNAEHDVTSDDETADDDEEDVSDRLFGTARLRHRGRAVARSRSRVTGWEQVGE